MAAYYHIKCYRELLTNESSQFQRNNAGINSRYSGICAKCSTPFYVGDRIARFNRPRESSYSPSPANLPEPAEFKQIEDSLALLPTEVAAKVRAELERTREAWRKKNQNASAPKTYPDNVKEYTEYSSQEEDEQQEDPEFSEVDVPGNEEPGNTTSVLTADQIWEMVRSKTESTASRIVGSSLAASLPGFIQKVAQEVIANLPAKEIHVTVSDLPPIKMGPQHKKFETMLQIINARQHALLIGPMGSGKTTATQNAAKALGKKFYFHGAVTDAYQLLGYMNAAGTYVETDLYRAWTTGGVFLLDEIDGSEASALVAFNAGLANGVMAFPCGITEKHPECVVIAAANTWGTGATAEYVGRNRLDAATLDRFVPVEWDYDEQLEMATAPLPNWTKRVQAVRRAVMAAGIRVVVSPRASYQGAALMAAGMSQDDVERSILRRTMTADQWEKVRYAS